MNNKLIEEALLLKYDSEAHIIKNNKYVNCNGLIGFLDKDYANILSNYLKHDSNIKYKNFYKILLNFYNLIELKDAKESDLILFKEKSKFNYNHIAYFLNNNQIIHAKNRFFNIVIENVNNELLFNKDYLILRKRG